MQCTYVFFSASTHHWTVFRKHVHSLSVKPLSNYSKTRWECRIESVKAICYQPSQIYDALDEIAETAKDSMARSEAEPLCKEVKSFNLLVAVVFWHDMLLHINLHWSCKVNARIWQARLIACIKLANG